VGPTNVRYADSINVNAFTIAPGFQLAGRRGYGFAAGSLAQMREASTYSGTVGAGLSTDVARRFSGEIGGTAGGSAHSDDSRTGQLLGSGRLYLNGRTGGAWGGGGIGSTWDGGRWRDLFEASAGAWVTNGPTNGVLSLTRTSVDDTIQYADALLTVRHEAQRAELSATLGTRFGDPLPTLVTDRVWGSISAVLWMFPSVGVVAAAGTYPIDFSQGYPGGRFASLAIRFAARRTRAVIEAPTLNGARDATARTFEVRPTRGGAQRLRVYAPAASSVEIMGTFSDWRAVPLAREGGGWWSVTLSLGRRSHEINLRVNGGPWEVPPGLTPLRDEFGNTTGILVVP
jgi:predicted carbohydrate-binding protein with CBM48